MTKTDSRMTALANLWRSRGCPEKMTIHIRKTDEIISVINRMLLEPEVRLTDRSCPVCARRAGAPATPT